MQLITLETKINAPIEKVFDMARNVQVHCQTAAWTNERVIEEVVKPKKVKKAKPKSSVNLKDVKNLQDLKKLREEFKEELKKKKKDKDIELEKERPVVATRKSPLLEKGQAVTYEAKHLGKKRRITSRITHMDPPHLFTEKMIKGPFKVFLHQHNFEGMPDGTTVMTDIIEYAPPGGPFASLIDSFVLEKYVRDYLNRRNKAFKQLAENEQPAAAPATAGREKTIAP